jgi:DNA-3-methyladenine glycosylase
MYECLNIITEPDGVAGCVLIRAIEPVAGLDIMKRRRPVAKSPRDLASGPGKLTLAMGITRDLNGADVTQSPLTVHTSTQPRDLVINTSSRIGITHCADWPLRFTIDGNPFVSRP